jgi:hypothetical protein
MDYRIEWAARPVPTNQYNPSFFHLEYIAPTGTTAMSVDIPMFYRVVAAPALPSNVYEAGTAGLNINAGTNRKITVEWASDPNGPWSASSWSPPSGATPTGSYVNITSPRFFRIHFINCQSNFAGCSGWDPITCPKCEWIDATDPGADRLNTFTSGSYSKRCLKIKAGQEVTFSGNFLSAYLYTECQECGAITNETMAIGTKTFIFPKPGYYNYYSPNYVNPTNHGQGMAGNIWVIP